MQAAYGGRPDPPRRSISFNRDDELHTPRTGVSATLLEQACVYMHVCVYMLGVGVGVGGTRPRTLDLRAWTAGRRVH